ncbi:MAG: DUF4271 domain-containing protein [Rikenellaceae bacterium]
MEVELENIADIPSYIFGTESVRCTQGQMIFDSAASPLESWFIVMALVIAAIYLAWLNHWSARGENHKSLFGIFGYMQSDYVTQLGELAPSFTTYIYSGSVVGVAAIWLAIVGYFGLSSSADLALYGIIFALLVAINIYQVVLSYLVGVVASSKEFFKLLRHFRGICYSMVGIVGIPTILCYVLTSGKVQNIFMYIAAFELLIIILLFLHKTFMLFISKKVSLLHTILYLCAVEIFPITLIWGFFSR